MYRRYLLGALVAEEVVLSGHDLEVVVGGEGAALGSGDHSHLQGGFQNEYWFTI